MTMYRFDSNETAAPVRTANFQENVIPDLAEWSRRGEACALVTLIGVDGNAPRAEGAQMAVSEGGKWSGYISGGCLEQAIALEAVEAIACGKPRLLRYGKGSPYFDIRLPCGSGLDVFIQPNLGAELIRDMRELSARRQPFALRIGLASGAGSVEEVTSETRAGRQPFGEDGFIRVYTPAVRCLVIGSSPIAVKLAELAGCAEFQTSFYTPEVETLPRFEGQIRLHPLLPRPRFDTDLWTAAILAFHDHEQELPVFTELLLGPCFFIAAIGSRNAHAARKLALAGAGFSDADIERIRSPAGLISGLKSAPLVALSILAQLTEAARERAFVS